ncbi:MAG: right-handed parallel beta-helix repeat-containing protein [Hamadaea sp.]|nr:right-handed parallel beta-helix repeat-containing protein [Hamadaea sp.]
MPIFDRLGVNLMLARGQKIDVLDTRVDTVAPGLKQQGQPVTFVTSDQLGRATFTSTQGFVRLRAPKGFERVVYSPQYLQEVRQAATDAASSASSAATSATAAQNAANLVGAPADTAIAAAVNGAASQTRAALDDLTERRKVIDANKRGVKADGVTNDAPAWNALVASCTAGDVITWTGRSMLNGPIIWKSGVSLVGQGRGKSVLATRDTTGSVYFSAIQRIVADGASVSSPLLNCTFRDFEIDGSGLSGTAANVGGKAMFIQFARRCQFLNLYLHDTVGTAFGCDFLPECLISGLVVERGGRNWDGVDGGHAGIGIGTGAWQVEDTLITNCHTIDCGQWGIFTEWQADQPYHSRGLKIVNNVATGCQGPGIADIGNTGVYIAGNYCRGNGTRNVTDRRAGIVIYAKAEGLIVVNNICENNAGAGITLNAFAYGGHTIRGNTCSGNTREGIFVDTPPSVAHNGLTIADNRCFLNGRSGIKVTSGASAIIKNSRVDRNHCYNNGTALIAGDRRGIDLFGGMVDSTVCGNRCYDDQATPTQDNGIASASGTWTNVLMEGNNLVGQATGASITGTVTGLTRRNNLGYVTEARGTGQITSAATNVTVIHGLSIAPTAVVVTPRTNENVWVTTIGASGFIVNRATAGAALDFTWSALV